jgi:hypothetical protein
LTRPELDALFGCVGSVCDRMSPIHRLSRNRPVDRIFIAYGNERPDTEPAALKLAQSLAAEGKAAEIHTYPTKRHVNFLLDLRKESDPLTTDVFAFLRKTSR